MVRHRCCLRPLLENESAIDKERYIIKDGRRLMQANMKGELEEENETKTEGDREREKEREKE